MPRTTPPRTITALLLGLSVLLSWGCPGGEVGTEAISRCYPEGACPESMFQGGLAGAEANVPMGEKLFQQQCASCHGPDGKGMETTRHVDFTTPVWHAKWGDDADIAEVILKGRPPMMPPAALGETQLRDVIGYLRSLKVSPSQGKPDGSGY